MPLLSVSRYFRGPLLWELYGKLLLVNSLLPVNSDVPVCKFQYWTGPGLRVSSAMLFTKEQRKKTLKSRKILTNLVN